MINVWVTGSKGQLGQEIKNNLNKGNSNFLFTKRDAALEKNVVKHFLRHKQKKFMIWNLERKMKRKIETRGRL